MKRLRRSTTRLMILCRLRHAGIRETMSMLPATTLKNDAASGNAPLLPRGCTIPFVLVTALFFLWGIPNNLNDVLIRQFMKSLELSRFQAGLVQSAFYLGYFLLALPAGVLMKRRGYKSGFLTGLFLFATGCFLFLPAANSGEY